MNLQEQESARVAEQMMHVLVPQIREGEAFLCLQSEFVNESWSRLSTFPCRRSWNQSSKWSRSFPRGSERDVELFDVPRVRQRTVEQNVELPVSHILPQTRNIC